MNSLRVCTDKNEWDDYALDNGAHPFQLWGWGELKSLHGWKVVRLFFERDDMCVGAVQVLLRPLPSPLGSFAYVPRGPVGDEGIWSELLDAAADYVKREHKAITLSVEPISREIKLSEGWIRAANKVLPAETIMLNLEKSEEDLMASMAKKTRQYIRKSGAAVAIRRAESMEDVEACLDIYEETALRAGFALHDRQYYRDLYKELQDHSPIFIAYDGSDPVAFLWLAISADTSYELYGGVTTKGQELRANYALKWYAIQKTKEWGLMQYDFGGLIAGGVATFKQGWSSETTTLAGTYDKPLSPLYVMWSKGLPFAKKVVRTLKRKA